MEQSIKVCTSRIRKSLFGVPRSAGCGPCCNGVTLSIHAWAGSSIMAIHRSHLNHNRKHCAIWLHATKNLAPGRLSWACVQDRQKHQTCGINPDVSVWGLCLSQLGSSDLLAGAAGAAGKKRVALQSSTMPATCAQDAVIVCECGNHLRSHTAIVCEC